MLATVELTDIILWLLYIAIPIIVFYVAYLILTKAFRYLGFTQLESVIIVVVSFIFTIPISLFEYNISNIVLFTYNDWVVGISTCGAVIPIVISFYLIIKRKIPLKHVIIGVLIVTVVTFFVTNPEPSKGIISTFPWWLLPGVSACFAAVFLLKKNFAKGASLAYASSTLGVLIGADVLHLYQLLKLSPTKIGTMATIGGAVLFDLVFLSGILSVILYGIIMFKYR